MLKKTAYFVTTKSSDYKLIYGAKADLFRGD
jgi:hypothetical protein